MYVRILNGHSNGALKPSYPYSRGRINVFCRSDLSTIEQLVEDSDNLLLRRDLNAVTWESRALDCHDTDHAASPCPVPQPGTQPRLKTFLLSLAYNWYWHYLPPAPLKLRP